MSIVCSSGLAEQRGRLILQDGKLFAVFTATNGIID